MRRDPGVAPAAAAAARWPRRDAGGSARRPKPAAASGPAAPPPGPAVGDAKSARRPNRESPGKYRVGGRRPQPEPEKIWRSTAATRSGEHTAELQSRQYIV